MSVDVEDRQKKHFIDNSLTHKNLSNGYSVQSAQKIGIDTFGQSFGRSPTVTTDVIIPKIIVSPWTVQVGIQNLQLRDPEVDPHVH